MPSDLADFELQIEALVHGKEKREKKNKAISKHACMSKQTGQTIR